MESEGNIPSKPSLLYLNLYTTFEEVLKIELPQTIHYINGEFEMRKFTVGCRRTEGKKDDVGLAFNLRSMMTSIPGDNACELNYILTLRTKFYRRRKKEWHSLRRAFVVDRHFYQICGGYYSS